MRGMRALRNFKPNRCYHLISRIANRAFYLTDEELAAVAGVNVTTAAEVRRVASSAASERT